MQHEQTQEDLINGLIKAASMSIQASLKQEETVNKLVTTVAVMDERLKTLEKLAWPAVITILTGFIGAIFAVVTTLN